MYLYVAGQGNDALPDHIVDHAAHQGGHENHRPNTQGNGQQHDQCASVIAPQVAPGQFGHRCYRHGHQTDLIASTGLSPYSFKAG